MDLGLWAIPRDVARVLPKKPQLDRGLRVRMSVRAEPCVVLRTPLGDVARQKGWLVLSVLPEAVLWT